MVMEVVMVWGEDGWCLMMLSHNHDDNDTYLDNENDWMSNWSMDAWMDEGKDGYRIMMMMNMMNLMMIDCLASNQG